MGLGRVWTRMAASNYSILALQEALGPFCSALHISTRHVPHTNTGRHLGPLAQALPLVNFGAYAIIIEVAFVSLCVGILALAPPSIVATMGALPGWTKGLMAAFGFITFVWQLLGLISVARESPSLYRFYIRINFLLTLIIIVLAIAFFATSAAKHSDSLNACINNYGAAPNTSGTGIQIAQASDALSGTGHDICNIFIWVQVGVMGLLLVVLGFTQVSSNGAMYPCTHVTYRSDPSSFCPALHCHSSSTCVSPNALTASTSAKPRSGTPRTCPPTLPFPRTSFHIPNSITSLSSPPLFPRTVSAQPTRSRSPHAIRASGNHVTSPSTPHRVVTTREVPRAVERTTNRLTRLTPRVEDGGRGATRERVGEIGFMRLGIKS